MVTLDISPHGAYLNPALSESISLASAQEHKVLHQQTLISMCPKFCSSLCTLPDLPMWPLNTCHVSPVELQVMNISIPIPLWSFVKSSDTQELYLTNINKVTTAYNLMFQKCLLFSSQIIYLKVFPSYVS